jgi:hypothetical protein
MSCGEFQSLSVAIEKIIGLFSRDPEASGFAGLGVFDVRAVLSNHRKGILSQSNPRFQELVPHSHFGTAPQMGRSSINGRAGTKAPFRTCPHVFTPEIADVSCAMAEELHP